MFAYKVMIPAFRGREYAAEITTLESAALAAHQRYEYAYGVPCHIVRVPLA